MSNAPLTNLSALAVEAWHNIKGIQRQYWLSLFSLVLLALVSYAFASACLEPLLLSLLPPNHELISCLLILIVHVLVTSFMLTPLLSGLMRLGIARSQGQIFSLTELLKDYRYTLPLGMAYFIYLGTCFCVFVNPLVVPLSKIITLIQDTTRLSIGMFAFLLLSRQMFIPLISQQHLGVWQAFKTVREKLKSHWFRMAILSLFANLIVILSVIPFGIGLIWTLPFANNVKGIIYRELFIKDQALNPL